MIIPINRINNPHQHPPPPPPPLDIAVDGWALTMLSKERVDMASICNSIGQSFGYFSTLMILLFLGDAATCNKYLRSTPSDEPMLTLGSFMAMLSVLFFTTTTMVMLFKREKPTTTRDSVLGTYSTLLRVCQLPSVRTLIFLLLTMKIGFGCVDSASGLKLQEFGLSKETMASIGFLMFPIYMLVPGLIGRFSSRHPLENLLSSYWVRLAYCACAVGLVYYVQATTPSYDALLAADEHGMTEGVVLKREITPALYATIFVFSAAGVICSSVMFTSVMQLFCAFSDPAIGGSYMSLLNTFANLGGSWVSTFSLKTVALLQRCHEPDAAAGRCIRRHSGRIFPCSPADAAQGLCVTKTNGYYPVAVVSIVLGLLWIILNRGRLQSIRDAPEEAWRVPPKLAGKHISPIYIAIFVAGVFAVIYWLTVA